MINVETKPFVKLGFTEEETEEVVSSLNQLLANYHLHYQKLRHFHWAVDGHDFFDLHEKFEALYNTAKLNIDEVAERIRVFGKLPMSNFSEYIEHSEINEPEYSLQPEEMVAEVLEDFEILLKYKSNALKAANHAGDAGTDDLITAFIRDLQKSHWMLTAWLKERS